jgi:hypothetical protein
MLFVALLHLVFLCRGLGCVNLSVLVAARGVCWLLLHGLCTLP